jgi:hypothetical protein
MLIHDDSDVLQGELSPAGDRSMSGDRSLAMEAAEAAEAAREMLILMDAFENGGW